MTIEHIPAGASWEKSGNASWGQCPKCKNWFHLGPEILKRPEVKLHCPHCAHEFHQNDAPRLIKAG
ncbi:MAG: hypothetical protein FJX59_19615 [Alphaproteobacteria bacterium]|nr:hypothetical protein [Alphaproteobacteria bacterium]